MSVRLSVCLSVCLSGWLAGCLSVGLSGWHVGWLSVFHSIKNNMCSDSAFPNSLAVGLTL